MGRPCSRLTVFLVSSRRARDSLRSIGAETLKRLVSSVSADLGAAQAKFVSRGLVTWNGGLRLRLQSALCYMLMASDSLLQNAAIRVKSCEKKLTSQVFKTERATGLATIGFGPDLKPTIVNSIQRAGGLVTRDENLLMQVVQP
jgi:hypothetical protein